jgi:membrane protein DedA with SNARE-associated domain
MFISLDNLLPALIANGYWLIFLLAVVEGPIISIVAGFMASLGYIDFSVAYLVLIVGDLIGDSLYYALGKYGRKTLINKIGHYIGLNEDRVDKMEEYIVNNFKKTFIFGKFTHGLGSVTWVATGMIGVPYPKFLYTNAITTAVKSLILITVGYFFGWGYASFDHYFKYTSLVFLALFIAFYLLAIRTNFLSKFLNKI